MYTLLYKYARLAFPEERNLRRKFQELMGTQWLNQEELQALQLAKLRRLLHHAFENVPFYRQRFLEAGIHPNDIQALDDLKSVPILTKEDIRQNLQSMVATNIPRAELRETRTGGSTGVPLRLYHSKERLYWSWAAFSRLCSWFGIEKGSKSVFIGPPLSKDWSTTLGKARMRLRQEEWLNSFDMGRDKMRAFTDLLVRFRPELLRGHTSALWLFSDYISRHGITDIKPKVVMGGADMMHDFQRDLLEKTYQCPVVDNYGCRELGQLAGQCPEGSMHVFGELNYLEVITNGRPAKFGELGDVVVTSLESYPAPLIRYANGDAARLEDKLCRCGRSLPVISELTGKKNGFFTTADGRLVAGTYFVHRLREWPGLKKFRVHQPSIGKVEVLFESEDAMDPSRLEAQKQEFLAHLGSSTELTFTRVEEIPPTPAGKYLFTSSDVPVNLDDSVRA